VSLLPADSGAVKWFHNSSESIQSAMYAGW
jgi:hypothetical protein